jgi:ankyrin repeat protein
LRRTPLIHAVNESKTSVVRLLISRGAELGFGSVFGKTTLHYACENGSVEIVKLLVDAGCDVSHQDMQGNTALQLCSQSSPTFTVITDIIHDRLERSSS